MNDRISRRSAPPSPPSSPPPRPVTPSRATPPAHTYTPRQWTSSKGSSGALRSLLDQATRSRSSRPTASGSTGDLLGVPSTEVQRVLSDYLSAATQVPPPAPETPAQRARTAGLVVDDQVRLPALTTWQDFIDKSTAKDTTGEGHSRLSETDGWAGAGWTEAVRLATDGWNEHIPDVDLALAELRTDTRTQTPGARLVQVADTCGSEVDVAAYLAGIPECMLETELHRLSTHGRVVTFLVPVGYSCRTDHPSIINRGKALCVLGSAIVRAGHSIEVWSGFASQCPVLDARCSAVANVVSAGEPFDPGRLMFAMAHPAMLRRSWLGVWDSTDPQLARAMQDSDYGTPQGCLRTDLPDAIANAYTFPLLAGDDRRWSDWDHALEWSIETFHELGLVAR